MKYVDENTEKVHAIGNEKANNLRDFLSIYSIVILPIKMCRELVMAVMKEKLKARLHHPKPVIRD